MKHTEHEEQVIVHKWLVAHGVDHFAVPNAARRSPRLAAYLKAEGLTAGVADLIITDPPPRAPETVVVALEMKAAKGVLTPEQTKWLWDHGCKQHWRTHVAYSADDAIKWLTEMGYADRKVTKT